MWQAYFFMCRSERCASGYAVQLRGPLGSQAAKVTCLLPD